jgi:aminopeptidase N
VQAARGAIDRVEGDPRVLWARALVGVASGPEDHAVAAALVDGPPEGLSIDQEMRWSVAVAGSALEAEGADDRLAAERARDTSDRGDRAMAKAGAARPVAARKDEVWERLHNHGYDSLHLALAAASGFWQRRQADLVEPYVLRFFEGLPALFSEWEPEAARGYFTAFFPHYRIEESTREMIAGLLARDDLGPMLRRMLVEEDDVVARSLACRAFAEPAPEPVAEPVPVPDAEQASASEEGDGGGA